MIRIPITHVASPPAAVPVTQIKGKQVTPQPARPKDAVVTFTRAGAGPGTTVVMDSDQPLVYRAGLIPTWLSTTAPTARNVVSVSPLTATSFLLTFDGAVAPTTEFIVVSQRSPAFKTTKGGYVGAGRFVIGVGP